MEKKYLLAPGPVQIPAEVLLEMAKPMIHHRTPEFEGVVAETQTLLKELFQTTLPVLTFAASGTGAMEAAIVNTHSRGEKTLVIKNGKFSERMAQISETYGLLVELMDLPNGGAANPEEVKKTLAANPDIVSVMLEFSETSTGAMNDVEAIAKAASESGVLVLVDAISALGVTPVCCDKWGLDVVIGGSQKSLMLPPGLSFCWFSERAWRRAEKSDLPKFYFNALAERDALKKNTTAWTPAINLIKALNVALKMMKNYGWEKLYRKNEILREMVHAGVKALGLKLFSESPSISVTAIETPEGLDGARIVSEMKDKHHVTIAGGQGDMKGKIFRVGTLGYIDTSDILVFFGALETTLKNQGYPVKTGAGLTAAQEIMERYAHEL